MGDLYPRVILLSCPNYANWKYRWDEPFEAESTQLLTHSHMFERRTIVTEV